MSLEQDLRRVLAAESAAIQSWPDPVARVFAGMTRRRRRRAIMAAAGAVLAIAIAAPVALRLAAPRAPEPAEPGPSVIPWVPIPVPPTSTASPMPRRTAAPCLTAQLSPPVVAGTEGAAGHLFTIIEVRNTGTRCTLAGSPTLIATNDSTGRRATVPTVPADYGTAESRESPATIDAGESARLDLVTALGCDGGANPTVYRDIALGYTGTDHELPGLRLETTCPIEMSSWYREPAAAPTPEPRFATLKVSLEPPWSARRGTDLEFVVVLTNPSDNSISLDPCPAFKMHLGKVNSADGLLNCVVDQVRPHESLRFAMRLRILNETPVEPAQLFWMIVDDAPEAPYASVTLPVE